jgi:hypothetical protein
MVFTVSGIAGPDGVVVLHQPDDLAAQVSGVGHALCMEPLLVYLVEQLVSECGTRLALGPGGLVGVGQFPQLLDLGGGKGIRHHWNPGLKASEVLVDGAAPSPRGAVPGLLFDVLSHALEPIWAPAHLLATALG